MKEIDDAQLAVLLEGGNVAHFELREEARGYKVVVAVMGRDSEAVQLALLMNSRRNPRKWISVDRFLQHLRGRTPAPPSVRIHLRRGGKTTKRSDR